MRKKKLSVALMALVLVLVLAACKGGIPSYDLEIDPKTGAGTASYTIRVAKNDAPEVGNNFDKPENPEDPGYIKSPEALLDLFKGKVPAGYTVTMKDEPNMVENDEGKEFDHGNYAYTLTFSFKDIEDYNNKIMSLVGQGSWDGANASAKAAAEESGRTFVAIEPAKMTVEVNGDKQTVNFVEDLRIIDVISYWASAELRLDTTGVFNDLFAPDNPATYENTVNLDLARYSIKFGDTVQEYRHSDGPEVSLSATVDVPTQEEKDAAQDEEATNPKTGSSSVIPVLALAAVSLGGIMAAKKRK
ncbi:MAG TPA: NPXTG-anchored protein [Bacillota bacterium]|nr:NPXTG-anchored protein [Bacillota bacterium]